MAIVLTLVSLCIGLPHAVPALAGIGGGLFLVQGALILLLAIRLLKPEIPHLRKVKEEEGIASEAALVEGGKVGNHAFLLGLGLSLTAFGVVSLLTLPHADIQGVSASYWAIGGAIGTICVLRGTWLMVHSRYNLRYLEEFEKKVLKNEQGQMDDAWLERLKNHMPKLEGDARKRWLERRVGSNIATQLLPKLDNKNDSGIAIDKLQVLEGFAKERVKHQLFGTVGCLMCIGGILGTISSPFTANAAETLPVLLIALAANGIFVGLEVAWLPIDVPEIFDALGEYSQQNLVRQLSVS